MRYRISIVSLAFKCGHLFFPFASWGPCFDRHSYERLRFERLQFGFNRTAVAVSLRMKVCFSIEGKHRVLLFQHQRMVSFLAYSHTSPRANARSQTIGYSPSIHRDIQFPRDSALINICRCFLSSDTFSCVAIAAPNDRKPRSTARSSQLD